MPKGCHLNHAKGSHAGRWNANKIVSSHGYSRIRVGKSHPLSDPNGYAYEHLVVWVSCGNQRPASGQIIHHKNGDKTDNRIENLEVITKSKHNSIHNVKKQRDKRGRFSSLSNNNSSGEK